MNKTLVILSIVIAGLAESNELRAQFDSIETLNRVILLKISDSAEAEVKNEVIELFKGIKSKVEGIEWVHVGELSSSSQGFNHAVTLTFTSKKALAEYEKHVDHLRIQKLAPKIVEDFATYEYWEKL